jgi:hypothetical protein
MGGDAMTVFIVETFVVKAEKSSDLMPLMKRSLKYAKQNPKKFKFKSYKLFSQMFGGVYGSYVAMSEYDSMADLEQEYSTTMKDTELMKMMQEFMQLIVDGSYSMSLWNGVM